MLCPFSTELRVSPTSHRWRCTLRIRWRLNCTAHTHTPVTHTRHNWTAWHCPGTHADYVSRTQLGRFCRSKQKARRRLYKREGSLEWKEWGRMKRKEREGCECITHLQTALFRHGPCVGWPNRRTDAARNTRSMKEERKLREHEKKVPNLTTLIYSR